MMVQYLTEQHPSSELSPGREEGRRLLLHFYLSLCQQLSGVQVADMMIHMEVECNMYW